MEEIRKAFDYPKLMCQVIDSNTLVEELEIKRIIFDDTYEIGGKLVTYTDLEHPITYCNSRMIWNALIINREYYEAHKQEVDQRIGEIVRRVTSSDFSVKENDLISDELLQAISNNQNVKNVSLGSKEEVYLLTERDYNTLRNGVISKVETFGVSTELENNFDPIIKYNQEKPLVGDSSYKNLVNENLIFYINSTLSSEEFENLKYLNEEASVEIMFDDCKQVLEVIKRFEEMGQHRNFTIHISDKNEFNLYLFEHIDEFSKLGNITVSVLGDDFSLSTYLKYEKKLIDMVLPAMNYSPFEKYMYAYNVVKQFKEYKENEQNKNESRQLYSLLDNEYMVCAGFSNLLSDLLDKLGISNIDYSVKVADGLDIPLDNDVLPNYYDADKKEEVMLHQVGHSRCRIHLKDPKYGIDGYYIADPTWDNDMQDDLYNFSLMTYDEYIGISRETFLNVKGHDELYFVHSLEEFYHKLNFLLDKNADKHIYDYVRLLVQDLKSLDTFFYTELVNKYPDLLNKRYKYLTMEMMQDILLEVGERIVSKNNNYVSGSKIMECVKFLYDTAYGMSPLDADMRLQETMKINKERQEETFPKRYKIDENGIELVVLNAVNKFDIAENPEMKL